jgi:preprotein translocase subunit SecA
MLAKVLGTTNEAQVKKYQPLIKQITALESGLQQLDDADLRQRFASLKERATDEAALDGLRVEAFAVIREVADRRLGMWNAVANVVEGFDAWGDQLQTVSQIRAQLDEGVSAAEIDVPAAVYARIREEHPQSKPPYRMRAHDVQLVGGLVLHEGKIGELRTGEGKTLVAIFPAVLNALLGRGVHVVTVNDYLAARDAAWNQPVVQFLGMDIGAVQAQMDPKSRQEAYQKAITYGTNSEFGFDYLRDNLKQTLEEQVCRDRYFAIVDEVDSVLIDEARTPLIISGPAQGREAFYQQANDVAAQLAEGDDFEIDIKDRTVTLTEEGLDKAAGLFGVKNLYDADSMHLPHYLDNALRAHFIFKRDVDYLVAGPQVKIIDESTGRTLEGRRWSEGLHQAVECKEGVPMQPESQTFATITYQNYFRLYGKLAGMTGTAMTEAAEFDGIYKLQVITVPTNKPVIRRDMPDLIYGSVQEKFDAISEEVLHLHRIGQPVLVGTASVEASELLSENFKRKGVPHELLNARHHEREATIVAQAGQLGAVTIATNMAGRGTDIVLQDTTFDDLLAHWAKHGLAPRKMKADAADLDEALLGLWVQELVIDEKEQAKIAALDTAGRLAGLNKYREQQGLSRLVKPSALVTPGQNTVNMRDLGGLAIVGTERHESRRIDNQLRGRAGRQGDPGFSRFFISLEDQLMRRFAGDGMRALMVRLGLKDGMAIESKMVSRRVEKAQTRVEEINFGFRKNLLEYDEVMNLQRRQIYSLRQEILRGENLDEHYLKFLNGFLDDSIQAAASDGTRGESLAKRIKDELDEQLGTNLEIGAIPVTQGGDACLTFCLAAATERFENHKKALGAFGEQALRFVLLETIDRRWTDHIDFMDQLRRGISLQSYGQKDPKLRFKEEGFRHFEKMHELLRRDISRLFLHLRVEAESAPSQPQPPLGVPAGAVAVGAGGAVASAAAASAADADGAPLPAAGAAEPKPNDPCPCGSGLRYRDCHGYA